VINGEDSEIINLNKKMIVTLCKYPQTDTSIVNNNLSTAAQFVPANAFPDIRRMLFARLSLDMLAWFETFLMLMSAQIRKEQVGNTDINKTAECIERKIKQTQDLQGCEKLPDDALLPDYMTKDFIADIIKDRIKQQPEETKFLISILHPEIEALLLLMSIDDRMIKEARENVKASLKQQKFNLPKYASDTFFVKVIEAYILEAKKNFNPCLDTIRTEEKPGMFIIPTEIKK